MTWLQKEIRLEARKQGTYLITDEVLRELPELKKYKVGLLNLFVKHTSAGITLNENYDPDVRKDMTTALARIAPEGDHYLHNDEGPDDMPAHVRASVVGISVDIPIKNGKLNTGTWQGIYLCEFRRYQHARTLVATVQGDDS